MLTFRYSSGDVYKRQEYGEGKNQNFLRPEDTEKIVWVFDNMVEVPGYSQIVKIDDILDEKTNDCNLNISRYVDNAPPQELHDVRAYMLGGVPNVEIDALNGLIAKYDIDPADIFSDRDVYKRQSVYTETNSQSSRLLI